MFDLSKLSSGVSIFDGGHEVTVFEDIVYGKGYSVHDARGQKVAERSSKAVFGLDVLNAPDLREMKIVMSVPM